MADPLSIASGIAGIIALAGNVVSTCYKYGCAVKGGPVEIQRLLDELISLSGVLNAVKALIDGSVGSDSDDKPRKDVFADADLPPAYSTASRVDQFEQLIEPLEGIRSALDEVQAALRKAEIKSEHHVGRMVKKLLWPLKSQETQGLLSRLERYKATFMLALHSAHVSFDIEIRDIVQDIRNVQQIERFERQLEKQNARMGKIRQWLCPINVVDSHRAARRQHLNGTGTWMLKDPTWSNWLKSDSSFLWLYGIPGSGKTVLTSTLLEHCYAYEDVGYSFLIYFYCDFRQKQSQKAETLLGGLVYQLCAQFEHPPEVFEDFVQAHIDRDGQFAKPTCENLTELLFQMLYLAPKTILVIDALDECLDRQVILDFLRKLPALNSCSVKALVTSRQLGDIEAAFSEYKSQSLRVHAVNEDIDSYIVSSILANSRLQRLGPELKKTVRETLVAGACGMFRWVQCQIDTLKRLRTDRDIRQALTRLPRDLKETYNRILEQIDQSDAEVARRALMWLVYASRPLMLSELAEAVAVDANTESRDPEALWYPSDLLTVIGSLARYTAETEVVVLAHQSVKEHLESEDLGHLGQQFAIGFDAGNQVIAEASLRYLLMQDFATGNCAHLPSPEKRFDEYPLLGYASRFWPLHVSAYLSESQLLFNLTCRLMDPVVIPNFRAWLEATVAQGPFHYKGTHRYSKQSLSTWNKSFKFPLMNAALPKSVTPLYYAASFGLTPIVKYLINCGVDLDEPGGRFGGTALHAAVFRNHEEIAAILLEAGCNPMAEDDNGAMPFEYAERGVKNPRLTTLLDNLGIETRFDKLRSQFTWMQQIEWRKGHSDQTPKFEEARRILAQRVLDTELHSRAFSASQNHINE